MFAALRPTLCDFLPNANPASSSLTRSARYAALLLAVAVASSVPAHAGDSFTKPTKEELSMTSLPGYPGASAVVLNEEEITHDDVHSIMHYKRIKILNEAGKKYANVELRYTSRADDYFEAGDSRTIEDITGRTIHPDGTIIPFTGKPYAKVLQKSNSVKRQTKVFTLPEVEVGSIIEYRYFTRYEHYVSEPQWYIQGDLFVKQAHYAWYPLSREISDGNGVFQASIANYPVLPANAKFGMHETPATKSTDEGPQKVYELQVSDVPPKETEEFMPPIASFSYRVLFSYVKYRSGDEFWKGEGKTWSKRMNAFMEQSGPLKEATTKITAGATTDEEKLKKIYAAVMALENTSFTRQRERREDQAAGLGKVNNVSDVLSHQRGDSIEVTALFAAMARAAGMKSYLMLVPDREEELFTPNWLSFRQFDAVIAIVTVNGKDEFFDPGFRYCKYGQLAWEHTLVSGLRQTEAGADLGRTPGESYSENKLTRVANLDMDDHGEVKGKITLTFAGAPALRWRHAALRGDEESLRHGLREALEAMVPKSVEVKVDEIANITEFEQPLVVNYQVSGMLGTQTGKRLVLPADIFVAGASSTFPHEKRIQAVYFHYPQVQQDATRINFSKAFEVEAVPEASKFSIPNTANYNLTVTTTPTSVTMRRNYVFGRIIMPQTEYAALRTFYSQFESKDQESVVLKTAPATKPNGGD